MPIEGLSDIIRMPRLGKIRLGVKVEVPGKNPYPRAVDYFVCPPEVQAIYGEQPKELAIMFPTEDPRQFAQQWLRCYSMTQGLVCIGSGVTCRRKVDKATGAMASHDTTVWVWKEGLPCNPEDCPDYGAKCRRVMNLQFLLPQCPGLGVWQIDTSSFHSIVNINSMIEMLQGILGRCSRIPLTLALGPVQVSPQGLKQKTVYILHLKRDVVLAELAKVALLPLARVLVPTPEAEEPPEDLFPQDVLSGAVEPEPEPPEDLFPQEVLSGAVAPPAEETFPGIDEERGAEWKAILELMPQVRVAVAAARSYFAQVHDVSVPLAAFETTNPPGKLTLQMVKAFRERLRNTRMNLG